MAYYRNSSSGCGELLVAIVLVITVGTLLVKGCVSLVSSIDFDGDWNRKPVKTDNHVWGEHGVDPVLRTSTGAIYKAPAYPNYYFDITLWCPTCDGIGCSDCYNTGHQKVRIPTDGKIPKTKPLPSDYYQHKGAQRPHR